MEFAKNFIKKISGTITGSTEQANTDDNVLDICFLLDVTGSMGSYIEMVGQCLEDLVYYFSNTFSPKKVYMSFVGYRDFKDHNEFESSDFELVNINNVFHSNLYKKIKQIQVSGGGDTAENIRGGVKEALKLKWRSKQKFIVLIADAPTHGKKYNGGCDDGYPDEDIRDAIESLIKENIAFFGVEFCDLTDTMYSKIKEIYEENGKKEYFVLEDMKELMKDRFQEEEDRNRKFMDLIATAIKATMFKILKLNNKDEK